MLTCKPLVAFLGYNDTQTSLINFMQSRGLRVYHYADLLEDFSAFDLVVSFGYRHILRPEVLVTAKRPILNLHISYLPYNKGAHPNFWSWVEGTPSGVTIHEIDNGIDTGPIVKQKITSFEKNYLTFRGTQLVLLQEMEELFIEHFSEILSGTYCAVPQSERGSFHRVADLPEWMESWDMPIADAIATNQMQ